MTGENVVINLNNAERTVKETSSNILPSDEPHVRATDRISVSGVWMTEVDFMRISENAEEEDASGQKFCRNKSYHFDLNKCDTFQCLRLTDAKSDLEEHYKLERAFTG
jgi:hypothetical protein